MCGEKIQLCTLSLFLSPKNPWAKKSDWQNAKILDFKNQIVI